MELDSSTPEKFSRHVIMRIPGHAFESNVMAGSFVLRLLSTPQVIANAMFGNSGPAIPRANAYEALLGSSGSCQLQGVNDDNEACAT